MLLQRRLMDEEGHVKLADFGPAADNMWPGEKIEETGTPSYITSSPLLSVLIFLILADSVQFRSACTLHFATVKLMIKPWQRLDSHYEFFLGDWTPAIWFLLWLVVTWSDALLHAAEVVISIRILGNFQSSEERRRPRLSWVDACSY